MPQHIILSGWLLNADTLYEPFKPHEPSYKMMPVATSSGCCGGNK